ncbi:hypothetical protein EVAR_101862_1 [Eumeta japonica]|uniref:Gustatory receptor n=1 Tax=Eumeta variegata TaxID=151549 RepID=A0A4C1SQE3_EUMVA|nr:hypothetical protein EVAR_101862_1 [Eumeta japonica]
MGDNPGSDDGECLAGQYIQFRRGYKQRCGKEHSALNLAAGWQAARPVEARRERWHRRWSNAACGIADVLLVTNFRYVAQCTALEKKIRTNNALTLSEQNRDARCASALTYFKVYTAILDMSAFIESTMSFPALSVYILLEFFDCLQIVLLPCLPILATERISSEVDKIKLTLMHQIIDTFDSEDSERRDIERFLEYVEARPYQYCVWRLFNVDTGLLLGFVSLCITYLIVVIQFTHLL